MEDTRRAHPHSLPYRGTFGLARPAALEALALPPRPMPSRVGLRPLKAWRYVGIFGPEAMACACTIRIGPARQSFWAVWDRRAHRLEHGTHFRGRAVRLAPGRAVVETAAVRLHVVLAEQPGVETVCPAGAAYAWTRKQAGVSARGALTLGGRRRALDALAVIDDTAAYYPRHTQWRWCAGVGCTPDGTPLAWNLVSGVNDPPHGSERTVWVAGVAREAPPVTFAPDLSAVDGLRFAAEAERRRRENLLVVRSSYRQPFGTFSGVLPGGVAVAEGYGVMEEHDVVW